MRDTAERCHEESVDSCLGQGFSTVTPSTQKPSCKSSLITAEHSYSIAADKIKLAVRMSILIMETSLAENERIG